MSNALSENERSNGGLRDPWGEAGEASVLLPGTDAEGEDPDEVTVQLDSPPPGTGPRGGGPDASDVPVFVDESGRRSRTFRRIGIAVGLACATYAVVIVATLLSGNAGAPWLPVPGQKDDEPAARVDTSDEPGSSPTPTPPGFAVPGRPGQEAASGPAVLPSGKGVRPSASGSAVVPPSGPAAAPRPLPSGSGRPSPVLTGAPPAPAPAPSSPAAPPPSPEPSPSATAEPTPPPSPSPAGGAGTTVAGGAADPVVVGAEPGAGPGSGAGSGSGAGPGSGSVPGSGSGSGSGSDEETGTAAAPGAGPGTGPAPSGSSGPSSSSVSGGDDASLRVTVSGTVV
ncbi:translation initiation factor IF-2 [Streptomyces sp. NPDC003522]